MRRIYAYIISIILVLAIRPLTVLGQDTITVPLKIMVGAEASGPIIYLTDKKILNTEFSLSYDIDERFSPAINAGYLDYSYSQYNYSFTNKGLFVRAGTDINLLNPDKAQGKYWAGIGLKYGISMFSSETPSFSTENYWGTSVSSVPDKVAWAHFLEFSPGVRAEIFRNFSMGWRISMRMLLYSGTGKDLRPIYLPGFGNAGKNFTSGMTYFLVWNIPYKKKQVIIMPEEPEESDENTTGQAAQSGGKQQGAGIKQ